MNENAKLWVKALRSGFYVRGQGERLCFTPYPPRKDGKDCFSCLGVACDLYRHSPENETKADWEEKRNSFFKTFLRRSEDFKK